MDADGYVVEYIIHDRLAEARARAEFAALHYQSHGGLRDVKGIGHRLTEFAKAPVFLINGLKREELIAANSLILHELYFDSLGGDGISGGVIDEALTRDFGSVDRWRAEFVGTGKALRGGSGWVLLSYSHRDRRLVNQWV